MCSHQVDALSMMIEKESGILKNGEFSPLWQLVSSEHGHRRLPSISFSHLEAKVGQ